MTRSSLARTLRRSYWLLGLVLVISLGSKMVGHIPGLAGTQAEAIVKDVYEYLKDMALVLVTVVAAYLANVFQKRQGFLAALKEEWRDIIKAKSALFTFTQLENPTKAQYLDAFCSVSETIDNMRAVYGNVGETRDLIGIYPYAPLHDMRRALQAIEPKDGRAVSAEERKLARDAILQSFYALRETFLEELDSQAPDNPLLAHNGRRLKRSGAPAWARRKQERERVRHDATSPPDPRITEFLTGLYEREQTTPKPWRSVEAAGVTAVGLRLDGVKPPAAAAAQAERPPAEV